MSVLRTGMLLAALTAVFLGVGYLIGGTFGMLVALGVAVATNAVAYWSSDSIALRMHNAQPVTRMSSPALYDMVARLAARADLPMPGVYLIDARQPNAFATGRDPEHGAVAVTTGLLQTLAPDEVEGVIAHELAHIAHRDTLIMTIAATVAGAITMLANIGFYMGGNRDRGKFGVVGVIIAAMLAPMAAALIQMAVSRTREYAADRGGADLSGDPLGLASALAKISQAARGQVMSSAETHPNSAHMFIVNPLSGLRLDRMFATHPPVERRIRALRDMASTGDYRTPVTPRRSVSERISSIPRVRRR